MSISNSDVCPGGRVRTNVEIGERLMRRAMRASGARTKKAAIEEGLRLLIQVYAQASIRRLRGKVRFDKQVPE